MSDKAQGVVPGVLVPFAQSAITGLLLAAAALSVWQFYQVRDALRLFLAVLACGTLVAWMGALGKWRGWIDAAFGRTQPEPTEKPYQLQVALTYNEGQAGDYLVLPVDYQRFEQWAAGIDSGASLGENHWCGSRAIFSKGEYHRLLDELQRRGLVRRAGRHHSSGYCLTSKGQALINELARRHRARLSPIERRYHPGAGISR